MNKFILALLLIALAMALLPSMALATTYNQPTTFSMIWAGAYQSCLETNDQFFIAQYDIRYAVPANAPPSVGEAYLGSVKYSGASVGTVQPFSYFDAAGTSEWFYAVYFTAAQVTALGLNWAVPANYSMEMVGNPTLTWDGGAPPTPQNLATFSIWYTSTDVIATDTQIETKIRQLALYYQQHWGGTTELVQEIGGVLKLTSYGETYFTSSISSLRIMAPNIFADSLSVADMSESKLISDYYIDITNTDVSVYGANWAAQTFTVSDSYEISGVDVRLYRVGTPGTITASVRAIVAGLPSGGDLATGTYDGDTISMFDRGEWYKITFTTNYQGTSGTQYAIVLRATAGDVNNYFVARDASAGTYTGGQRCSSVNSGGAWAANAGHDIIFAIISIEGASGAYQAKLAAHLDETEFGLQEDSINNLADSWGLSRSWMTSLIWLLISIGVGIVGCLAIRNSRPLFPVLLLMMPIGSYTGFLPLNITLIAGFICALGIVYVFAFRQA